MKKILAAILLTFYVTASSGVVINIHYCMNKIDSMKLGESSGDRCGKCGMESDVANGCCHDEIKIIKIQDEQKINQVDFELPSPEKQIASEGQFVIRLLAIGKKSLLNNHSPPLSEQDNYLFNCVFRI